VRFILNGGQRLTIWQVGDFETRHCPPLKGLERDAKFT